MNRIILAITLLLTAYVPPARSQQAPPPTPEVQALQSKLMQEINANLQCTTGAIALQREVARLTDELKALKDKSEPKK